MTVAQLKASLKDISVTDAETSKKKKAKLQTLLSSELNENQQMEGSAKGNDHLQLAQEIINPSSLTFSCNDTIAVATLEGQIYIVKLQKAVAKITGNIIQRQSFHGSLYKALSASVNFFLFQVMQLLVEFGKSV